MNINETEQMKIFADQLWGYIKPKVKKMLSANVQYFRAEVDGNLGNNTLVVKRPLDTTTLTLPCTTAMSGASKGDQVTVFVFGDLTNAVVVSDGKFSTL